MIAEGIAACRVECNFGFLVDHRGGRKSVSLVSDSFFSFFLFALVDCRGRGKIAVGVIQEAFCSVVHI